MGLFNKVKTVASSVANTASDAASNLGGIAVTNTKENAKLLGLKSEIATIEGELKVAYEQIGKKYVEVAMSTGNVPDIGVMDILKAIEPKLEKKMQLEEEIIRIEKELKDQLIMQEKALVQAEFEKEKEKLDKALKMGVMTQEEYDEKIKKARKKLDNFDEIRRLKQQLELGVITEEEYNKKLKELTE